MHSTRTSAVIDAVIDALRLPSVGQEAHNGISGYDGFCSVTTISKTQVDQLGDRLRKADISEDDLRLLDAYRESFAEAYEEVVGTIRHAANIEPTGRPAKTRFSIIEKLRREKTMQLSRMQDVAGCRIVVSDIQRQDQVVERLKHAFAKVKVTDRRRKPSHGYRAVHLIVTARNKSVEIQVRTELQDLWAQQSEVLADRVNAKIKYGGGNPAIQVILSLYSGYVANIETVEEKRGSDSRKAQLRQSLDELARIFVTLPRRVN